MFELSKLVANCIKEKLTKFSRESLQMILFENQEKNFKKKSFKKLCISVKDKRFYPFRNIDVLINIIQKMLTKTCCKKIRPRGYR